MSTETDRLRAERDALAKFKNFVHARLDRGGVPSDPDPEGNKQHGCRIGGRLDWLFERLTESDRLRALLRETFDAVCGCHDCIRKENPELAVRILAEIGEAARVAAETGEAAPLVDLTKALHFDVLETRSGKRIPYQGQNFEYPEFHLAGRGQLLYWYDDHGRLTPNLEQPYDIVRNLSQEAREAGADGALLPFSRPVSEDDGEVDR